MVTFTGTEIFKKNQNDREKNHVTLENLIEIELKCQLWGKCHVTKKYQFKLRIGHVTFRIHFDVKKRVTSINLMIENMSRGHFYCKESCVSD